MAIQVPKATQGRYVRLGTAVGLGLVDLAICYYVGYLLNRHVPDGVAYKTYLVYGIPVGVFVALAVAAFLYLNKARVVDFLIATESEMKKVSWPSRAELFGSTMVVIMTVAVLAVFIMGCDALFQYMYWLLGLW